MKETRKKLGKLWKQGKTTADAEKYYLEFKDEIDKELGIEAKPILERAIQEEIIEKAIKKEDK